MNKAEQAKRYLELAGIVEDRHCFPSNTDISEIATALRRLAEIDNLEPKNPSYEELVQIVLSRNETLRLLGYQLKAMSEKVVGASAELSVTKEPLYRLPEHNSGKEQQV